MKNEDHIDLGRFVRTRDRQDGTHHVFMSVPKALRPPGWPANITLPEEGSQYGSLNNKKFLDRVLRDAQRLNKRLEVRRDREKTYSSVGKRNTRALTEIYFRTQRYRELGDARKYRNKRDAMIFVIWAERRGDPDFAAIMKPDLEDFLAIYDDRKAAQLDLRSILNVLGKEAVEAGWRIDNPAAKLSWKAPEPKEEVVLWKGDIPKTYAAMARQMGQPGLAALIEVGLVVGQRLGDLRMARHGINFQGGRLRLKQTKTHAKVNISLPPNLCELIERNRVDGSPYLFNNGDTGTGYTADNLWARFAEVRYALTKDTGPKIVLRTLRHSAVCAMVDAKVPLRNISAVTGHRLARVNAIVERYAIDTEGFADAAMMMVNRANGGSDDDFSPVDFGADRDWAGGGTSAAIYKRPAFNDERPGRFLGAALGQHRLKYSPPLVAWPEDEETADHGEPRLAQTSPAPAAR